MAKQVLSNLDFNSVAKIINLPDPTSAQDAATKNYVDSALEGLAWKADVKVAASSNISVASPGATIDGNSMAVNDRVLLKGQTAGAENGIYVWNGAAVALTRSYDCKNSADFNQAVVSVIAGTSGGSTFRQTTVSPTVGTSTITWVSFGATAPNATISTAGIVRLATQTEVNTGTDATIAVTPGTLSAYSGLLKKFTQTFGDGSATSYAITHNLNTLDVQVAVYRNSGSGDEVQCDVNHTSVNVVTLVFATAPASNAFRVVVIG